MSNDSRKPKGSPGGTGGQFDTKTEGDATGLPSLGAQTFRPKDAAELAVHLNELYGKLENKTRDRRDARDEMLRYWAVHLPDGDWVLEEDIPESEYDAFMASANETDIRDILAAWDDLEAMRELAADSIEEGDCYRTDEPGIHYSYDLQDWPEKLLERNGCYCTDLSLAAMDGVDEALFGHPDIDTRTAANGKDMILYSSRTGRSVVIGIADGGRTLTLNDPPEGSGLKRDWPRDDYMAGSDRQEWRQILESDEYKTRHEAWAAADQWQDVFEKAMPVLEREGDES